MESLTDYLSSLTPQRLARVIECRPECWLPPRPASLAALAARLSAPPFLGSALLGLRRPALQVAEALAGLGDRCERAELAAALGVAPQDPTLAGVLAELADRALVWPQGDRLRMVDLTEIWPCPLDLGAPLAVLLGEKRADDLRQIARRLGVPATGQKAAMVSAICGWLSQGENLRRLCATAPADTRTLLNQLAWEGPFLDNPDLVYGRRVPAAATWAIERGLLAGDGRWGAPLQMPCEVALGLRGPDYRLPYDPVPPTRLTVPVDEQAVTRESAAAAANALARLSALLEDAGHVPIALLKTGGVGVRELRRVGKAIDEAPDAVRFWLDLAVSAGLLAADERGLVPTEAYDDWCQHTPGEQLGRLVDGWLTSEGAPFYLTTDGPAPALVRLPDSPILPMLRMGTLAALADVPAGAAFTSPADVAPVVAWRAPVIADDIELPELIEGFWREAVLLGLVAHGALSPIGRAATTRTGSTRDDDERCAPGQPSVAQVAQRLLPAPQETVLLQADLTAVAVGTPARRLVELLDAAADRETRTGAWSWRFSADSVRRALDSGRTPGDLVDALRSVATGGRVPQPLEFLIGDVARRHGAVRVRPVGCCLRSDDTTLLTEMLHARALGKLGLTALAPTVLGSRASVDETLTTLRRAGYAPVAEDAEGTVTLERVPRQRAVPRATLADDRLPQLPPELAAELFEMGVELPAMRPQAYPPSGEAVDAEELARKLLRPTAAHPGRRRTASARS